MSALLSFEEISKFAEDWFWMEGSPSFCRICALFSSVRNCCLGWFLLFLLMPISRRALAMLDGLFV